MEEAKKINKSLSALGMVVNALTDGRVGLCIDSELRVDRGLTARILPAGQAHGVLIRILQVPESLGGNSRTTLVIICSPSCYDDSESPSTLFGIWARSIKTVARVNAELSPFELRALLSKANDATSSYQKHMAALEAELAIWHTGGQID